MADRIAVMDQGRLLQIGMPSDVYNTPTTAFVATFLGDASSFRAEVSAVTGTIAHLVTKDGLRSSIAHRGDLTAGDALVASIRPERVRLSHHRPTESENLIAGVVDFVSYLGSYVVYVVRLPDNNVLLRASEPIPSGVPSFSEGDQVFASWRAGQAVYVKE